MQLLSPVNFLSLVYLIKVEAAWKRRLHVKMATVKPLLCCLPADMFIGAFALEGVRHVVS